jgi:hypothetical protein
MADKNTRIKREQVEPLRSDDLDALNVPEVGQIPALGSGGKFEWVDAGGHAQNTDTQLPITAVPTDQTASGIKIVLTATGTFNFGDVGYIKSDGTVGFADATVIATASGLVMCADAQIASTSGNWLLIGVATNVAGWNWTPGGLIYLTITGTTGNTLSQTKPTATDEVVQILGVATHADRMFFNPQLVQIELV